jgi:molecular chaperone GrpE
MSEEQNIATNEAATAPAEATAPAAETTGAAQEELQTRLAEAEAQAAEYKDQWLRAAADYKNFKRRVEIERFLGPSVETAAGDG